MACIGCQKDPAAIKSCYSSPLLKKTRVDGLDLDFPVDQVALETKTNKYSTHVKQLCVCFLCEVNVVGINLPQNRYRMKKIKLKNGFTQKYVKKNNHNMKKQFESMASSQT
ncbi:hypothetical protein TNCV_1933701 [Trichonephila clavipes]|nr:hypothetical protein TNCV_1933701 [Trichonephila clavipes]